MKCTSLEGLSTLGSDDIKQMKLHHEVHTQYVKSSLEVMVFFMKLLGRDQ